MDFETKSEGGTTVVTLAGRLDAVTAPEYEKRARELIDGGALALVIDFDLVDYVSSAGLRALLVTAKVLKTKEGRLRFANVKGSVRSVFEVSGFTSMFELDDSVSAALAALS